MYIVHTLYNYNHLSAVIYAHKWMEWHSLANIKVAVSDVYGDFTYEDVYLRSWDLAKGILGLLGQVSLKSIFMRHG